MQAGGVSRGASLGVPVPRLTFRAVAVVPGKRVEAALKHRVV